MRDRASTSSNPERWPKQPDDDAFQAIANRRADSVAAADVSSRHAAAYSLLTHEQLIDLTWNDSIVPLLKSRYPNLTPASLTARGLRLRRLRDQDMGTTLSATRFL